MTLAAPKKVARKLFDAPTATTLNRGEGEYPQVPGPGEGAVAPPELPTGVLQALPVPKAAKPQPLPLTRIIMPIIMVLAMGAMVAFMVLSGTKLNPMTMMFPLFMVVSMLAMMQPKPADDADDTRRTYLRHLMLLRDQAMANAEAQRLRETAVHPPAALLSRAPREQWWQRGSEDEQFLNVRIGLGRVPLCTPIEVEDPGASDELDPVCAIALRRVVRTVGTVPEMPVVLQMRAFPAVAVVGADAPAATRAIIAQLAFHHGPQHVKLDMPQQMRAHPQWEWLKWFPHTTAAAPKHKITVVDAAVCGASDLAHLGGVAGHGPGHEAGHEAQAAAGREAGGDAPHTVLVCFPGPEPQASHHELVAMAEDEGLVLIAEDGRVSVLSEVGQEVLGAVDLLGQQGIAHLARTMASAAQSGTREQQQLPLRGLEPTAAQLRRGWVDRAAQRLAVGIGVQQSGAELTLDLKESAHGGMGPHGLCVGATGSGKSELLRTLVVSLAAQHDPETLNLVLVDFKGGATFLGLEDLPHTSAVITNLAEEAVLVERMHDAIAGEMHRRQELLRSAGNFANVGEYLKARRQRPELEPMPALVIVVDEFSELLGQHPDFADLFVAVGRLGRSLHMHLLLASQRLEEGKLRGLDSHLSYRIGLKTFSAAESRQVLGVPDAYHLPNRPGAGLLKTADGELVRFHTDYVSGPLMVPARASGPQPSVRQWHGWEEQRVDLVPAPGGGTYLEAVVVAAQEVAAQRGMAARQIWLPPLPASMPLAEVLRDQPKRASLQVNIGVIDRPYEQRQDALVLDFNGQQGHVALCGGPQSGKTTALHTLVLSLALAHPTSEVRMYILDLAGKGLAPLAHLGHVAGVAHRNEPEKVARVVDEVLGLIDAPEQRHTFLVVDGWHVLSSEFEEHLDALNRIAADGLAARVHLVVSTPRWTAMRPAVRDLIAQRLELKLGEALDSLIDRKAQERLPRRPGMGLTDAKELMLIAHSSRQDVAHVASATAAQQPVPALKLLPERVDVKDLHSEAPIVLGIGGAQLAPVAWNADESPHLLCLGGQGTGKSTALATVMHQIAALGPEQARLVVIDHRRSHLGSVPEQMLAGYAGSRQASEALLSDTVTTLRGRLPGADISPEQLKARNWWDGPELFLVIDDLDLVDPAVLQPLLTVLPHARDIGLHVVAARKLGGALRALFQPFLAELKDQNPSVLVLAGERDDGPIFGVRPSPQVPGRAVLVERGVQQGTVQVAMVGQ